jgi:hypothetical protein
MRMAQPAPQSEGTNGCRMNGPVDSVILVFTGAKGNEMIIVAVKK